MNDTDAFTDLEVFALTLIGEAESLGQKGMEYVASTIMNRVAANLKWMGGSDVRSVCLAPSQYSTWNDSTPNQDRDRVIAIGVSNPTYQPYQVALGIAKTAMDGLLRDGTGDAVSYFNHLECFPHWAEGKTPCFIDEPNWFYDLSAVS